jgi:ribosomal protein L37AE/L43A
LIVKERTKPLTLFKLESLLERIPQKFPKKTDILSDRAKFNAGFNGENSLDYHLTDLPEENYYIFHDLRLPRDKTQKLYFQLDSLIITPHYCLIIEVKNLIGNLYFDHQFNQMIRIRNGIEEAFPDPIIQVEFQASCFKEWLSSHKFAHIPIFYLVVITNIHSVIKISPSYKNSLNKIVRGKDLIRTIHLLTKNNTENHLSQKDIKKLSKLLIKNHKQINIDIVKQYEIKKEDLTTGVICPNCGNLPMKRAMRHWLCLTCSNRNADAHIKSIYDYALLINPQVKNEELRNFLHINSSTSMYKILRAMDLKPNGSRKAATYTIPLPK